MICFWAFPRFLGRRVGLGFYPEQRRGISIFCFQIIIMKNKRISISIPNAGIGLRVLTFNQITLYCGFDVYNKVSEHLNPENHNIL